MGNGWGWRGTKVKRLLTGTGLTRAHHVQVPVLVQVKAQAQRSGASCQVRLVQVQN